MDLFRGLCISLPQDWHVCPTRDHGSSVCIRGRNYYLLMVAADGACALHSLWGIPVESQTEPGEVILSRENIRNMLLDHVQWSWNEACSLHSNTMEPLLKALVDSTWKDVLAINSERPDGETVMFEKALPDNVFQDIAMYKSECSVYSENLRQIRERFDGFAERFFVEDNEAELVRPLAVVLGYLRSDDLDVLKLGPGSPDCHGLEVDDCPLAILHECGEGKTKYQALFRPLRGRGSSDFREAFFHVTDDELANRKIVDSLQNFADNPSLSDANRALVRDGRDIFDIWFGLRGMRPLTPPTCTN